MQSQKKQKSKLNLLKFFLKISLLFLILFNFSNLTEASFSLTPSDKTLRQFSYELIGNEEKQDSVIVENLTNELVDLHFYSADGTQSNQGTFALTTLNVEQKLIGKWATFKEPYLTLKPKEKKEIPFTIKVPKDLPPGVYAGGIAAETFTGKDKPGNAPSTVNISSRIVVKLFIKISGEKIHDFSFEKFDYNKTKKPLTFNLEYQNKGNTILMIENKIEISKMFKSEMEILNLPDVTLFQGDNISVSEEWIDAPSFGLLKAKAVATFYEFDIASNQKTNPQTLEKELNIKIIPWTKVIFLLVLIIAMITTLIILNIKNNIYLKSLMPYTVKEQETLNSIAETHNISWKKLAKINKIKAPYTLKVGQTLLVPATKNEM